MPPAPAPHYQKPFYLTDPLGNNAFDYQQRAQSHPEPQLRIAPLIELKHLNKSSPPISQEISKNLVISREIAFTADDDGKIKNCAGLENFLLINDVYQPKQKLFIFDNHNHAFYFWHLARLQTPSLKLPATLIHIDQHKDSRIPGDFITPKESLDLNEVFRYTNEILNVGNFIPPAFKTGLIDEMILIDSEKTLNEFQPTSLGNKTIILDIDVDFFAPQLDYIGNHKKLQLIHQLLPLASVITIATSPFFIDQQLAIEWVEKILTPL